MSTATASNPASLDRFIGQKLVHVNFTPVELRDVEAVGERVVNQSFSTLNDAVIGAQDLIAKNNATKTTPTQFSRAAAIVQNDSQYAIILLSDSLLLKAPFDGSIIGRPSYRTFDSDVVAAVRGDGKLLANDGKAHWWN